MPVLKINVTEVIDDIAITYYTVPTFYHMLIHLFNRCELWPDKLATSTVSEL
jgi:hypothetical protein